MALKHTNPTKSRPDRKNRTEQWAVAPYNFVPLPEKMVAARQPLDHDRYHIEGVSGWIECELETCSPTYVRGMLTREQYDAFGDLGPDKLTVAQKTEMAPFFSAQEQLIDGRPAPRIPGSSLRGMIRSLVEIIGYGRMRYVSPTPTFTFRAVAAAKDDPLAEPYRQIIGPFARHVRAGYLVHRQGKWFIRPATTPTQVGLSNNDPFLKVKEHVIQGKAIPNYVRLNSPDYRPQWHKVSFDAEMGRSHRGSFIKVTRIGSREMALRYEGVLVCSGNMLETGKNDQKSPRKNHALVLLPDDRPPLLEIRPQAIQDYLDGLTPFQKEKLTDWGSERGCLRDGAPVFYVPEGKEVSFFGHSPNFRIPARLSGETRAANPLDFVPDQLRRGSEPDLADAIFGWVEDDNIGLKEKQRAGRVFFHDATYQSAQSGVWFRQQPIAPNTLSGPKATTFQHYLVQDGRAGQYGHHPDNKVVLAHYGTPTDETRIRGHKLYWHKGDNPDIEASSKELSHEKQLTRIMPLKPGVRFTFKIRFENLRPEELGVLWWALALPGETDKVYRHKIGMGKPLGMGTVSITPRLVITDRALRYQALFDQSAWQEGAQSTEPQPYLTAFESYLLQDKGIESGKSGLAEVERIQMLLAMLEWHEGTPEWLEKTRYMEIERDGKINEYKERPVLPDPLGVLAGPGTQSLTVRTQPVKQASTKRVEPSKPKAQSATPQVGDLWQAKIYFIDSNGDVYLELTGIPTDKMMGRILVAQLAGKRYQEGQSASVMVQAVVERNGEILVECEPTGASDLHGTVKWFNESKGYGFITPDGGGDDVYVHKNRLSGLSTLREEDRVIFKLGKGMKGIEAQQVRLEKR
ncbi:MAG: TIGR03986 family CRISPR-associated RAMP protein [Anaerolineae bacterium]|nr:TIGR03986 family CRISPR-associated RAMP protein [Anaerolineae bacterium]